MIANPSSHPGKDRCDVAVIGKGPAADWLRRDLAARGLAVGTGAGTCEADGGFTVRFDPDQGAEPGEFWRRGPVFRGGAAARAGSGNGDRLARGDAANLGWKLALVAHGLAPDGLLDSYDAERRGDAPDYRESSLTSAFAIDRKFRAGPPAGTEIIDGPVSSKPGAGFEALFFTGDYGALPDGLATALRTFGDAAIPITTTVITASAAPGSAGLALIRDPDRALHRRFGAMTGAFYLVRPDHIVAARWQHPSADAIAAALAKATGHGGDAVRAARSSGW